MTVIRVDEAFTDRVRTAQAALQAQSDADFALTHPRQRDIVNDLVGRIGTMDWQEEGFQSPELQRDLSIKFHWGHDHRFAEDLAIPGKMGDRHIRLPAEFFEGFGLDRTIFRGRDVLDVGCWTGGTTLSLKMLGARRVTGLEEVRKYADTAHRLATEVFGFEDVECHAQSLYQYLRGSYDLVYVPGVVYHLSDPVLGLRRLFNRLNDGGEILVESAGIAGDDAICSFRGNRHHFGGTKEEMNRGGWAWFWPTARTLDMWLQEAGFAETRAFLSPLGNRVFGYGRRTGYRDITRAGLSVPDIE